MRLRLVLILTLLVGGIVLAIHGARIAREDANWDSLQAAVGKSTSLSTNFTWGLPASIDQHIADAMRQANPGTQQFVWNWLVRVHSFVRGSVCEMHLVGEGPFDEEQIGAALARFGGLRNVTLKQENHTVSNKADIALLCAAVHQLPKLKHLALTSHELDDDCITALRGHPTLESLALKLSRKLSSHCVEIVRSLPALKELSVGHAFLPRASYTLEERTAIRDALPGIIIAFH